MVTDMLLKLALWTTLLLAAVGVSSAASRVDGDVEQHYFFVEVFGSKQFPIPGRYYLLKTSGSARHVFRSPNKLAREQGAYSNPIQSVAGAITVGSYTPEDTQLPDSDVIAKSSLECAGLTVMVVYTRPRAMDALPLAYAIFHNGEDFVRIVDADPALWKSLLQAYVTINRIESKCSEIAE